MLVSHADCLKCPFLSLITFFHATKNKISKKSIFFVTILQDDSDARRESLIKGFCIYVKESPDVLVQEYMVSVLIGFWLFYISKLLYLTNPVILLEMLRSS